MSQRIIVEIQQDGQINVETKGIKGPKCRDYIAAFVRFYLR